MSTLLDLAWQHTIGAIASSLVGFLTFLVIVAFVGLLILITRYRSKPEGPMKPIDEE